MKWLLLADDHEPAPKPDWLTKDEEAIAACSKHEWLLRLPGLDEDPDVAYVEVSCERCPATMDDWFPDGHLSLFLYDEDGTELIHEGMCVSGRQETLVIPVTMEVLSTRHYSPWSGEEWEVEIIVEPRGPTRVESYEPDPSPEDQLPHGAR